MTGVRDSCSCVVSMGRCVGRSGGGWRKVSGGSSVGSRSRRNGWYQVVNGNVVGIEIMVSKVARSRGVFNLDGDWGVSSRSVKGLNENTVAFVFCVNVVEGTGVVEDLEYF